MAKSMQELMDMKIWFLWRWETNKNGKMIKHPFAADGGETGTGWAHRCTWVNYG